MTTERAARSSTNRRCGGRASSGSKPRWLTGGLLSRRAAQQQAAGPAGIDHHEFAPVLEREPKLPEPRRPLVRPGGQDRSRA